MPKIHELYLQIEDIENERANFLAKITDENINELDDGESKQTLLHMTLSNRDFVTAVALLEKGAKYNIKDALEFTVIDYAFLFQNKDFLLALNKRVNGLDPNTTESDGSTPLYWAVRHGHSDLIELWLKLGANTHVINNDNISILNAANDAVGDDYIANMRLLLKWGIGFKNDFTGVRLFDEITEGCVILNSFIDGKPITRQTPGCQNAYTNIEEIKEAISAGKKINIICKTSIFEQHKFDPTIYKVYKLLTSTLNLRMKLLFTINDHPEKIPSLAGLPDELISEVTTPVTLTIKKKPPQK